jgi:hypothetical protein
LEEESAEFRTGWRPVGLPPRTNGEVELSDSSTSVGAYGLDSQIAFDVESFNAVSVSSASSTLFFSRSLGFSDEKKAAMIVSHHLWRQAMGILGRPP